MDRVQIPGTELELSRLSIGGWLTFGSALDDSLQARGAAGTGVDHVTRHAATEVGRGDGHRRRRGVGHCHRHVTHER
ncbi:MAG: hypothetical protein ACYTG5_19835 [Planctomycetota bacterium]